MKNAFSVFISIIQILTFVLVVFNVGQTRQGLKLTCQSVALRAGHFESRVTFLADCQFYENGEWVSAR